MRVSKFDISREPGLAAKLKGWAAKLNLAAKASAAPTFKVAGPCQLKTRIRRAGVPVEHRNFMGGEEFRVSSVIIQEDAGQSSYTLSLIMTPTALALVQEVVGITMPLEDAIETFDGLKAWTEASSVEPESVKTTKAVEKEALAALPSVEETRASETWGGW